MAGMLVPASLNRLSTKNAATAEASMPAIMTTRVHTIPLSAVEQLMVASSSGWGRQLCGDPGYAAAVIPFPFPGVLFADV